MDFFINNAYAQAAPAGADPGYSSLIMLVAVFVIFYFLLIRPQQKRQKEHKELVSKLAKGDEVATAGGLLGKVTDVRESFVKVEIANDVVVTVQKHTVSTVMPKGTIKSA
ncbi:MAG: preprotein translocase subunit YajC [Chromatiales bacterium]|jgi:preprotein translocase subunit YajC|nr:preprotein translocase subunit YajC [Chromatiales bacterium]MDP6151327.1 preprotein translocase subunit YajC [Gammaproteobacteria bacterium]MDP7094144.1 preprotein translocase subunit YajC [Gammaproteobacteria bacterium]MDP7269924.1 preprotein translocase subunit YajC [Gammaproteobacteria bacterium]HJP04454.1 preprotein translocase subunit YajC [Gammaproteobacteria bacterium]